MTIANEHGTGLDGDLPWRCNGVPLAFWDLIWVAGWYHPPPQFGEGEGGGKRKWYGCVSAEGGEGTDLGVFMRSWWRRITTLAPQCVSREYEKMIPVPHFSVERVSIIYWRFVQRSRKGKLVYYSRFMFLFERIGLHGGAASCRGAVHCRESCTPPPMF